MKTYMVVFFGSALLAILGTPIVTRLGRAWGIIDVPGPRKVHKVPVPRIGGMVIVLATLALVLPVFALDNIFGEALRKIAPALMTLLAAGVFIFAIGLLDDLRGLRAVFKLVCLVAASLAVCLTGARIETISVEPWFTLDLGWVAWPVTVFWIVGVTVGMNFIDGLDGLAAGIAAIVCGTTAVFAIVSGQWAMAILMLALLGSLTGFLFFNFNPAKVFLGDCGSMFLGFILAAGSVICQAKTSTLLGLALPACALGVPIVDAAFTMIRRNLLDRRSIFAAEGGHIHHRLLGMGLRQRHVVIIIYAVTLASAGLGLSTMSMRHTEAILTFAGVLVLLLLVFHLVGAARLKETVEAIKCDFVRGRETKQEKQSFEDAQLRMREAKSFDDWWTAICFMSEAMDVTWIALTFSGGNKPVQVSIWRCPGPVASPRDIITMTIPVARSRPGGSLEIEAGFRVNGFARGGRPAGRPARAPDRRMRFIEDAGDPRQAGLAGSRASAGGEARRVAGRAAAVVGWRSCFAPSRRAAETRAGLSADKLIDIPGAVSDRMHRRLMAAAGLISGSKRMISSLEQTRRFPEALSILGVAVTPFDSYSQAVACIEDLIASGRKSLCVAVNPEKVYRALHDPALMAALAQADIGTCDGIGVVLAARLLHHRRLIRCTGCDLFFHLVARAAQKGWRIFLLGASAESNRRAAADLVERYPALQIVGREDGYFQDSGAIVRKINESGAEILFVAMGSPKQELWIAQHRAVLQTPFCMGVGGTFDVAAGTARRAPRICQKTGTEFLFQLATRPGWGLVTRWRRTGARLLFLLAAAKAAFISRTSSRTVGE